MHVGLPPPALPRPTVTSEFLKTDSGAGGFSQHGLTSGAVLCCGVGHRYTQVHTRVLRKAALKRYLVLFGCKPPKTSIFV
jgi:hypothetical protein